jgi:hypothetical protein
MKKQRVFFTAIILGLIFVSLFFLVKDFKNPSIVKNTNAIKPDFMNEDWLNDNCNCTAHYRNGCGFEGYKVIGNFCFDKNTSTYTNVIKKCSEYNCSGIIYYWNGEIWRN